MPGLEALNPLASAASAALDLGGAFLSDHFNRNSAQKQMDFQKMMSDSSYQRAADDLEKAGLNRILAVGNGASTPSGAGHAVNGPNLSSGVTQARLANASIDQMKANTQLAQANSAKAVAETVNVQQSTATSAAQEALSRANEVVARLEATKKPEEIKELIARVSLLESQKLSVDQMANQTKELARIYGTTADMVEVLRAGVTAIAPLVEYGSKKVEGFLRNNANDDRVGSFGSSLGKWLYESTHDSSGQGIFSQGGKRVFKQKLGLE